MPEALKSRIAGRIAHELNSLRDRAELRTLDDVRGIELSSNDYLGLATDPRLKQAALDGHFQRRPRRLAKYYPSI